MKQKIKEVKKTNIKICVLVAVVMLLGIVSFGAIVLGGLGVFGDENTYLNQYLPDALGGFAGVFLGFVIEFSLIQKIRDLQKRRALYELLSIEFPEALKDMSEIKKAVHFDDWKDRGPDELSIKVEDEETISISDESKRKITFNFLEFRDNLYEIYLPMLEDIMDSAEHLSLLKEEMLRSLQIVNINYLRFNGAYERAREKAQGTRKVYNKEEEIRIVMKSLYMMTEQMQNFT